MKYEEAYTEFDASVLDLIKTTIPNSFVGNLKEGGIDFAFPQDREIELKVKYDVREDGGAFSLKFSWDNGFGEEEEEENKEGEDED